MDRPYSIDGGRIPLSQRRADSGSPTGVLMAVCARFLIVALDLSVWFSVFVYVIGAANSGFTRWWVADDDSGYLDPLRMQMDYDYFKRRTFVTAPWTTYLIASDVLFPIWR